MDEELANLIIAKVNPKVRILVLVDACHSGGILDMDTPGLWNPNPNPNPDPSPNPSPKPWR